MFCIQLKERTIGPFGDEYTAIAHAKAYCAGQGWRVVGLVSPNVHLALLEPH